MNIIVQFLASIGIVYGLLFLGIAIATVVVIVHLFSTLRMEDAIPPAFVSRFARLVEEKRWDEAYDLARTDASALPRVLSAGMVHSRGADAAGAMADEVETIRKTHDAKISYLSAIGTIGPLLGLVGTVSGVIGGFR